jgi:hypothetical protein
MDWLVPKDKVYFDLFEQMVDTLREASDLLVTITEDYNDIKNRIHKMEQLEHTGDEITHRIFEHLNRSFITPLEPEEIIRLTSALDDILDYIEGTTLTMRNYAIKEADAPMKELAKLIQLCTGELQQAIRGIPELTEKPSDTAAGGPGYGYRPYYGASPTKKAGQFEPSGLSLLPMTLARNAAINRVPAPPPKPPAPAPAPAKPAA